MTLWGQLPSCGLVARIIMCACLAFIFKYDSHFRIWILERIILDIGSFSRNLKLEGVTTLEGTFYTNIWENKMTEAQKHSIHLKGMVNEQTGLSVPCSFKSVLGSGWGLCCYSSRMHFPPGGRYSISLEERVICGCSQIWVRYGTGAWLFFGGWRADS